jgi:acyl-CoA thioester hydrolase
MSKKDFSHISLKGFHHATPIQIRFVDIDKLGHVNNATILTYLETARVAYFNKVIGRENDWFGRGLILAHSEIDYLQPVYQDDEIIVHTRTSRIGNKSFTVENLLMRVDGKKEVLLAYATGVLVCMNYHEKLTVQIPEEWKEKLRRFDKL